MGNFTTPRSRLKRRHIGNRLKGSKRATEPSLTRWLLEENQERAGKRNNGLLPGLAVATVTGVLPFQTTRFVL